MSTVAEVKHQLRLMTLEQREQIAGWLEGYQGAEGGQMGVAEPPSMGYAAGLPPYMTLEEYLEFEERSPARHEYVNGVVHSMSGPSTTHNRIIARLHVALASRLRGGPCETFISNQKLKLTPDSDQFVYYPDLMVSCDPSGWHKKWIGNPCLVIEVLSPSTQHIDRREKAAIYRRIASIEEYVIVAQHSHQVTVRRRSENWVPDLVAGPEGIAELRSVEVAIPLAEIYEDVLAPAF